MRKIIGLLGVMASGLALVGCGNNLDSIDNTSSNSGLINQGSSIEGDNQIPTGTTNENAEYMVPSYEIDETNETSPETDVTNTVDAIYDSVVAITATSASAIGAGSGVLFSSDSSLGLSYIVTCFHVIDNASVFSVTLSDGSIYDAKLVGGYEDYDIAVMSIEETNNLTYAPFFDDSDKLKLGSEVVCIGNPLGTLPGSVSTGIVSYVNREINVDNYTKRTLIQTDVAINSGNSGGGLFNTKGALIGIVNAKYSSTGIEGLGFAIPINQVKDAVFSLLDTAKYDINNKKWETGYVLNDYEFGFTISEGYYHSGFQSKKVCYISSLSNNETATGANELQYQDIISSITIDFKDKNKTDINITTFSSSSDLYSFLYAYPLSLGDVVEFEIIRNNNSMTVAVPVIQYRYYI